jgi:hypothetical protein
MAAAAPAFACEVPDEGGNTPWRRAVAKVKYLPETEAWSMAAQRDKKSVQYVVSLDEPKRVGGRCYWPVEIRAEGKLWKRFLVTPQGDALREDRAAAQ